MDPEKPGQDEGILDPLIGRGIKARYRVIRKLATGRMGTVYVAQQMRTGERVALKVFHEVLAKDEGFANGLRQLMMAVRAVSRTHPNIVRVYECDQEGETGLFLAMELLEGRPLRELIRQDGAMDVARALRFARQMAEGLSVAHALGIVHTEVRPEHFMVIDKEETIKVIGFERARLREGGAMDHLIRSGVIPSVPEYLAPEQIRGEEITRQTDIYAFGVVLYEMLSGAVPFKASTPEAVRAMHLEQAPTPLRTLRPEIPVVVEAKVMQALEKEPKRRESYLNDVVNEFLYESALDELGADRSPEKEGLITRLRTALHSDVAEVPDAPPKSGWMAAHWKGAAIGAALLVIAALSLWILLAQRTPEVASVPSPRQVPGEVRAPAPVAVEPPAKEEIPIPVTPPQSVAPPAAAREEAP
ncbi:MAG TPA: serine/threonine-protein kinase, partial [Candidatus Methylomirabilis sp.]|nr:serine/threonine-protein kinase [Candidatus Methylomirabilis sp.]